MNEYDKAFVKTGRKMTKLVCSHCDFQIFTDRRKREEKISKMKKHIRSHIEGDI